MYQSNYKSLFRCHTLVESVNYSLVPPVQTADLFLYLLDTYDILLSHADGSMVVDDNDDVPYLRLVTKLEKYVFEEWETLFERIPGQLRVGAKACLSMSVSHYAVGWRPNRAALSFRMELGCG